MSILIEKPGILSTVQDLGRHGFRRFGVNPSGVMDTAAARLANILVGNDDNAAVVEMHFPAAQIAFERSTVFAICGADFEAIVDDKPAAAWRCHTATKGSRLDFLSKHDGNRAYLAIRDGMAIDEWLGSASTNLAAGVGGRKLAAGDRLAIVEDDQSSLNCRKAFVSTTLRPHYSSFPTVRVIAGGEFELLSDVSQVFEQDFTVSSNSNRMGFRLRGETVELKETKSMLSSAVSFGTIQLLPDGQLIVLMADHQTSGGYPRIAHVITRDLPLMAQLGAGDKVAFHLVDQAHAEALAIEWERELSFMRVACRLAARK